jgi:site-specific recombinase XerD
MIPAPQPDHALGPVADDWEAAEVWLRAVARKSRNGSSQTVTTYRFHLAKLRWFCENVRRATPSRWSMQDVDAFRTFLADLPVDALCAREGRRYASQGEAGYTPFRTQPSPSSRSDIERFVHAMFKAWHSMGYIRINPMGLEGAGTQRKINARRAVDLDLYELVLATMEREQLDRPTSRQVNLRDRFIFVALRELGLRASELVGSAMNAFYQLSDPKSKNRYWIFRVDASCAKGGKERRLPVTRTLLKSLEDYRMAFGLPPQPTSTEKTALLLSPHTKSIMIGAKPVKSAADRRFFGAWKELKTRQHLHAIVKERLKATSALLQLDGNTALASELEAASPHWLRHTFAKAALLQGQTMREVAGLLGHASVDTTMVYTDQDALDLVRAFERERFDLAREP